MSFFKLIRSKNLIIVALTQVFFQYVVIQPIFQEANILLALSPLNFILLVISTLLITASGNVINDIFDYRIDKINKGEKQVLQSTTDLKGAKTTYLSLVITGALISFCVAYDIENLKLFLIYPAAVGILFIYSYKLKHIPFLGNFVVSIFIALVIYILVFAERAGVALLATDHPDQYLKFFFLIYGFMWFAFIANLIREIIKDLEDIDGDRQNGSKSLPIVVGNKGAKIVAVIFNVILIISMILLNMKPNIENSILKTAYEWILLFLAIALAKLIWTAKTKPQFYRISQSLKVYMILGLLYLLFYYS